jgi:hypothetical protein
MFANHACEIRVNDKDLKLAAQAQREYLKTQMGTKTGTVSDFPTKNRKGLWFVNHNPFEFLVARR